MEITEILKNMIDNEMSPVVVCNMENKILYMNLSAQEDYRQYGGGNIVGKSILLFMSEEAKTKLNMTVEWFKESTDNNMVFAVHREKTNCDVYIKAIRDDNMKLIGYFSMHLCRTPESGEPYEVD